MRLMIAMMETERAANVKNLLYAQDERWEITVVTDGVQALRALREACWDMLLLHSCLPGLNGLELLRTLSAPALICPPRVLLLCERDMLPMDIRPDCVAPLMCDAHKLCSLLDILEQKPMPALAAGQAGRVNAAVDDFLNLLSMRRELKGRDYSHWLLCHYVPSPALEHLPIGTLYAACAKAYHTTPTAVERCLRVAVEGVFTLGSIAGIERCFGATIDPEKGKPTNRAFLLQAAQQLRLFLSGDTLREQQ